MQVADLTLLIARLMPEPHAGLLSGMLFGAKTTISPALYDDLVRTGTLHIVALSGMNITILMSLVSLVCVRFVGKRIASLLTIAVVGAFILFVGPSASVVRAAIMGSIALLGIVFGRQSWAIWSWLVAVLGMLAFRPAFIADVSFQLSVMATLGIILFVKKQETKSNIFRDAIADNLRVTLSAQVFTVPIIFFAFQRISLISPLANVCIGWVISFITIGGLAMVVAGIIWLPLAVPLSWIVWVPLQYVFVVVTAFSRIPFASLEW